MTSVIYSNGSDQGHVSPAIELPFTHCAARHPAHSAGDRWHRDLRFSRPTAAEIDAVDQALRRAGPLGRRFTHRLNFRSGDPVLRRKILLQGKMSLTNFLYADSYVALTVSTIGCAVVCWSRTSRSAS
jgi:hypothetical protein